jgi:methionyl aminopeptidase
MDIINNNDPDILKIINSPEGKITLYAPHTLNKMRAAGRLAAQTLDYLTPFVKIGISTLALDKLAHDFIIQHNAIPAPLNYKGFPKSICTSINHVICHGIPNAETILKSEDIVNIDVTVILDGWYGDTSRMFYVGKVNKKASRLTQATFEALWKGIEAVKPGNTTNDIGMAIENHIKPYNYGIVRDFCGHGLGKKFHDNPGIMHYGRTTEGVTLLPGMYFTIEPMINTGTHRMRILPDGWTAITADRGLSAQFEHSMAVTETGVEVFTKSPKGWDCPPYLV